MIMLSKLFLSIAIIIIFLSLLVISSTEFQLEKFPHIVLILADDLGYGDVSSYNPKPMGNISTPNIDKMTKQGMMFMDAHASSSVCTPSRYSLLTGHYNWRTNLKHGVLNGFSSSLIERNRSTLATVLKSVGYQTACVGKWHLGLHLDWTGTSREVPRHTTKADNSRRSSVLSMSDYNTMLNKSITLGPRQLGFDTFQGISASLDMPPYMYIENDNFLQTGELKMQEREANTRPGPSASDFSRINVSNTIIQNAIHFLRSNIMKSATENNGEKAQHSSPVFLFVSLTSPHTPILPSPEFQGQSSLGPYGDYVMQADDTVGQIMLELKRLNVYDNTLVIFTSDNGFSRDVEASDKNKFRFPHFPSGRYRGMKADIYEGGHRVPLVVQWPANIVPNSVNNDPVSLTDLFATFADIVKEGELEKKSGHGEDSYSLLPLLLGNQVGSKSGHDDLSVALSPQKKQNIKRKSLMYQRTHLVVHSYHGKFAIRERHYILAFVGGSGGWTIPSEIPNKCVQFFDLQHDPEQKQDLVRQVGVTGRVYVVPSDVEGIYLRLLLKMKHIYAEWDVKRDDGVLCTLINELITNQVTSKPSYSAHRTYRSDRMDNKTISEINKIVFSPLNNKMVTESQENFRKEKARQQRVKSLRAKNKRIFAVHG